VAAAAILASADAAAQKLPDHLTGNPPVDLFKGSICMPQTMQPLVLRPECTEALKAGDRDAILIAAPFVTVLGPDEAAKADMLVRIQALADKKFPPAVYFMGAHYVLGDIIPRDRARGREILEGAVSGGNLAAMELLAYLLIEGLGGPPDVQRGLDLLRQAADAGSEAAAFRLVRVLIENRRVDRDVPAAREVLTRLASQGNARASLLLPDLRSLEAANATSVVIVPKPDGSLPDVVSIATNDMPPIPPSLGFDKELHALWRRPFTDNPVIVPDLKARLATLPTPYIYELARRTMMDDPAEGRTYLFLGQMRTLYDWRRCDDPTGGADALSLWMNYTTGSTISLATVPDAEMRRALDRALEMEATLPGDTRPWWQCFHGMKMISAAIAKTEIRQWLKPETEWPALREESRKSGREMMESIITARSEARERQQANGNGATGSQN